MKYKGKAVERACSCGVVQMTVKEGVLQILRLAEKVLKVE